MSEGATCWRCGTHEAETWRFCSVKKEFVCLNCERSCPSHSRAMLPDGTHCRSIYFKNSVAARLMERRFLANTEVVTAARAYWMRRVPSTLPEIFEKAVAKYDASCDSEYRASVRPHLAALQEIIKELNSCVPR